MNPDSLSRLLCRSGFLLMLLYGVVVLFDVVPLKLLQPDWILNFVYTLSSYVSIPLVGVILVHLAGYLSPKRLAILQVRVARLAALMALLFLLAQPMLAFAVWKNFVDLTRSNRQQTALIKSKAKLLINAVQSAGSFEELQAAMARLQGPPIPETARSMGLDQIKKEALNLIKVAEKSFPMRLQQPNSPSYLDVYKRVARASATTLLGMVAFATLAWDPVADKNIIFSYLTSLGLFGFKPANLYLALRRYLEQRKARADVKAAKKLALQHEQRMLKDQAQKMRDQKRRINEDRKRAEKIERQRQQERK